MDEDVIKELWSIWNSYTNSGLDKPRGKGESKTVKAVAHETNPPGLTNTANTQDKPTCGKCNKIGYATDGCMTRKSGPHCSRNKA